jgi:hypothetical protein
VRHHANSMEMNRPGFGRGSRDPWNRAWFEALRSQGLVEPEESVGVVFRLDA